MKTRTIATLTALSLTALTATMAHAADTAGTVAQPVDGIEVIVVRAKRPETLITDEALVAESAPVAAALANEAADEIEVITVTATRADRLDAIRELAREAMSARLNTRPMFGGSVPRGAYRNWTGMPIR